MIRTWMSSRVCKEELPVLLHGSPSAEKSCRRKEHEFVGTEIRMNLESTTAVQLLNSYLKLNPALLSIQKKRTDVLLKKTKPPVSGNRRLAFIVNLYVYFAVDVI